MRNNQNHTSDPGALSRRGLLFGGAAAGLGAVTALGIESLIQTPQAVASEQVHGHQALPFYGKHQTGIATVPQAHATFVALDLHQDVDSRALQGMMRLLTDDAARLTQGQNALADTEPELGQVPARLSVTFGFGHHLIQVANGKAHDWLRPLPKFGIDRLEEAWCGGDLLLHIAADDQVTVAHALRMLLKDTRAFASVRWSQAGFRRARGSDASGTTMRNLFGQVDGTSNLVPGTLDFDRLVWMPDGGTSLVLRRIHMNVDTWDALDRSGREQSVGRTLGNGAPLTGENEHDEPDFEALNALGLKKIHDFSHMRRARSEDPNQRIFRRGYNYDERPTGTSVSDSGLIFTSYQADIAKQFIPLQQRLDELDLLNEWTTPIGSAVFFIPPGCAPGGYIGESLFTQNTSTIKDHS